ncbi:transcriptional regulator [Pseudomonas putida]|uniref:Transcriptional regulator n=1 Tax=Pseudomonas putida TaxID=303 RepID=A0AA37R9Q6_PSEPU|nr:helix-turn-helix transcriptional regulator [Pseudomonas putida]GLO11941.1 transcriptional regulator [Pseudomonas putida]GLO34087.1 transcriptional regulator [Pseudomonas putida]HDS0965557.1 helix-turn-helix transcriptional regulator [Pseudomonas putida]HDS0992258.1 helix-turn-helix transcriptional regulator [Pseudomonas putida]
MSETLVLRTSKAIKHFRTISNLSQERLAEKAGLDRTYISGIERGRRNITLESLDKIITALDIDINIFFKHVLQEANSDLSN